MPCLFPFDFVYVRLRPDLHSLRFQRGLLLARLPACPFCLQTVLLHRCPGFCRGSSHFRLSAHLFPHACLCFKLWYSQAIRPCFLFSCMAICLVIYCLLRNHFFFFPEKRKKREREVKSRPEHPPILETPRGPHSEGGDGAAGGQPPWIFLPFLLQSSHQGPVPTWVPKTPSTP